jgi:hypothetical protein
MADCCQNDDTTARSTVRAHQPCKLRWRKPADPQRTILKRIGWNNVSDNTPCGDKKRTPASPSLPYSALRAEWRASSSLLFFKPIEGGSQTCPAGKRRGELPCGSGGCALRLSGCQGALLKCRQGGKGRRRDRAALAQQGEGPPVHAAGPEGRQALRRGTACSLWP